MPSKLVPLRRKATEPCTVRGPPYFLACDWLFFVAMKTVNCRFVIVGSGGSSSLPNLRQLASRHEAFVHALVQLVFPSIPFKINPPPPIKTSMATEGLDVMVVGARRATRALVQGLFPLVDAADGLASGYTSPRGLLIRRLAHAPRRTPAHMSGTHMPCNLQAPQPQLTNSVATAAHTGAVRKCMSLMYVFG